MGDIFVAGIEHHDKAGQRTAVRTAERLQLYLDEHSLTLDAEQDLASVILDRGEHGMLTVEHLVAERHFAPFGGIDLHRQRHPVLGTAHHFENFHQTGFVHDPVMLAVLFIEMKAVEFFFLHHQLAVNAAGNFEGFTSTERQHLIAKGVL
ncbi:hypothetical protein D3C84_788120 [compost metagenome]